MERPLSFCRMGPVAHLLPVLHDPKGCSTRKYFIIDSRIVIRRCYHVGLNTYILFPPETAYNLEPSLVINIILSP